LKVESAGGPTYDQGVAPAPSNSLCAWQTIEVNVVDPPCEPDSNNSYTEAESIEPQSSVTGVLCPTEDPSDWYRLDIPVGKKASGSITYYHGPSNEGGAALQWQDSNGVKIKQSDSSDAYNWLNLSETELLPGTYYIQVMAFMEPGAFAYLLETDIEMTDATPTDPVDVSMNDLDCDVTWIDARYIGSNYVYGAGPAGTWLFNTAYSTAYVISRTTDPLNTIPAFCNGRMYYVEDYSDDPAGIDLVDYSSPATPIHTDDVISMPFNVECMTMNSQYLFVAVDHGSNTYVHIFDYSSDPTSPSFVNSFEVPHNQIKMALLDPEGPNTALVTMTTNDLSVYDVENPLSVSFKDNTTLLGYCTQEDLAIDGWFIAKTYLNNISGTGAVQVYKYSASSGLEFWGAKTLSGDGAYVTAANYYAYVENGNQTIACIYYGAQNSLEFKTPVNAFADVGPLSYRSGKLVAVTVGGGFKVWDYSDSDNPSLINKTNCVNNPKDGVIDGDYLYFVDAAPGYGALKTVKRTGPNTFIIWDDDRVEFRPSCIAHYGDVMAVGSFDDQYIALVNQTDPEDPAIPLVLYCDNPVTSVAVTQTTVYAATQGGQLRMIDVSDWPNYDIQADYGFPGQLWNLRVYHNYLLGSYYDKVRIFGISDPISPYYYGDYSYGGSSDIRDMELQGDYLYLDTGGTIEILNIKDTLSPVHTGGVNLPYALTQFNLAVEDSYGYAADWAHSPVVVTLFPPNAPSIFGEPFGPDPGFTTRGLIVDSGTLYILHDHIGLQIFNLY